MSVRVLDDVKLNNATKDMVLLAVDNSNNEWEAYSRKLWELEVHNLPLNSVVWDIGAYNAFYAIRAVNLRPDITAIAFEPHPNNALNILKNVASNNVNDRVTVMEVALLGDSTITSIDLNITNDISMPSGSSIKESSIKATQRKVTVNAICGDYMEQKPRLIKIDVEGAEYDVLSGMTNILKTIKPTILFEMLEHDERIITLLVEYGYTVNRINDSENSFEGPYKDTDRNYLRN